MSKVVKGLILGGAILLTAGAAAFAAPGLFATAGFWTAATSLATSAVLSGLAAQLAGKPKSARAETGVEYTGTVEPRRMLYGELLVAGMHTIPPLTSGTNNKMLHSVLTLVGHEVNDITDVYFGQDLIADADIGAISGASTDGVVGGSGAYAGKAWIRRYLGTSSQTADYILNTAFTDWTSDHRGRGIAYAAVQLELDEEVYKTGRPECLFRVQGKKCYDPRLDTSPGANPTNASYIAYTSNPALCLADYLIDDDLGLGEDAARIDWDMVADAADICDELVDVPTAATQPRYTCNIALLATTPYENNIEALAACMLGSCLHSGGKWRIRAGAWEVPSFEVNANNIMNGGITVSTAYSIKDRWNGVRGSYVDPDNLYQANEFPAVQTPGYVTEDGESVFKDTTFAGCTNVYEAQRNAIMLLRKSRNKRSCVVQCDLSLWKVRPGMTGIVTLEELGWTNKQVRCESWGFNPAGTVELGLREESSDDWDDPVEGDYTEPLSITAPAPAYFTPSAPSALTAVGTPRAVNLSWTAPALMPTGAYYQIFEHTSSTPFASATLVKDKVFAPLVRLDKSDTTTRYYWVRVMTADGTAGPEHPTSAAGVAGTAQPTTRTHLLTDAGPVNLTGSGNILVQSETITTEEVVEITATCRFDLNAASGGTDLAQLYACYGTSNAGADVYAFSTISSIDMSGQSITLTGLVKGSVVGAGTYNFGLRAKLSQLPAGPPDLSIDVYDITVRVTVITL